ncbi:MAG: hypothetical protein EU539_11490 [Promethearchaeota archaeon]|nr:MAG: hypothetical protein EU539_11490 [Candidatus Lokiarchaeota archaeon]
MNHQKMAQDDLKSRIVDLENNLDCKEAEIIQYIDRIGELEEMVMKLEAVIPEDNILNSKKVLKKAIIAKYEIALEEKDRKIRELKNRMGSLRKEKIKFQHEVEKYNREKNRDSIVIRLEEEKPPFEILVNELQSKINKQNLTMQELKQQIKSSDKYTKKLEQKDEEIENLKIENKKLNKYVLSLKNSQEETSDNLLFLVELKDEELEKLRNKLQKKKNKLKNLKIMLNLKEEIINELINQIESHRSEISDPLIDMRLERINNLNEQLKKKTI